MCMYLCVFNFNLVGQHGLLELCESRKLRLPEEGTRSPGTKAMGSCEMPGQFWELNFELQRAVSTVITEPSLQPSQSSAIHSPPYSMTEVSNLFS